MIFAKFFYYQIFFVVLGVPRERAVKNIALKKKYTTKCMHLQNLKVLYFLMKINLAFHCHLNNLSEAVTLYLSVWFSQVKNWFSYWKLSRDYNVKSGLFFFNLLFFYFTLVLLVCKCFPNILREQSFLEAEKERKEKDCFGIYCQYCKTTLCNSCRFGDIILMYDSSHAYDL